MAETSGLNGKRVLVVEDEALVSMLIESMIEDFGGIVAGPFMHVAPAVAYVTEHADEFDIAILDVNVSGERSFPIAEALSEKGKPFVYSTGYDERGLEERWRSFPSVRKPFSSSDLEGTLVRALAASSDPA
jgi:CheY-like chemotaxis protein